MMPTNAAPPGCKWMRAEVLQDTNVLGEVLVKSWDERKELDWADLKFFQKADLSHEPGQPLDRS